MRINPGDQIARPQCRAWGSFYITTIQVRLTQSCPRLVPTAAALWLVWIPSHETFVHIVSLSDFDQFVREQEHFVAGRTYVGLLLKQLETEEKRLS